MPWPLIAAAALAAVQAAEKKKREDAQMRADTMTQAGQQQNSGYTRSAPVNARIQQPSSGLENGVAAAGATWAQAQAFQDQASRDELSKIYGDYLKSQTAAGAAKAAVPGAPQPSPEVQWPAPGGPIQSQGGPVAQDIDPITGLPRPKPSAWQYPGAR